MPVRWVPPIDPWYKINFDGVTFASNQSPEIGAIICGHVGRVEVALITTLSIPLGSLETEAKALEEGVFFAWDMGVRDVIFECDSKNVSYAMNSFSEPPIAIGNIIQGTWQKLLDFRSVQVSHVRKKGNCPTHILAQYTRYIEGYVIWIEKILNILFLS